MLTAYYAGAGKEYGMHKGSRVCGSCKGVFEEDTDMVDVYCIEDVGACVQCTQRERAEAVAAAEELTRKQVPV